MYCACAGVRGAVVHSAEDTVGRGARLLAVGVVGVPHSGYSPAASVCIPTVLLQLDLVTWVFACWWYCLIWYKRGRGILLIGVKALEAL